MIDANMDVANASERRPEKALACECGGLENVLVLCATHRKYVTDHLANKCGHPFTPLEGALRRTLDVSSRELATADVVVRE